jgi:hypothetical protein
MRTPWLSRQPGLRLGNPPNCGFPADLPIVPTAVPRSLADPGRVRFLNG